MPKSDIINENAISTEETRCGLCGEDSSRPFLTSCGIRQGCDREYKLVRCGTCGLVFLNPRPTKTSILDYYSENDAEKAHDKPRLYEKFYFNFFRRIPLPRRGTLLDVGCGSGRYIYTLREKGWDVKGIDIAYTDYGKKALGLDIYEGDFLKAGFSSESFDAVTFWWTLEHMYEPLSMLKESCRILKKDGVLIIGVPNIDSLEAGIFGRHWFHLFLPKHLYQFSPVTLRRILAEAGFKRVKIRHDLFSFGIIGSLQCFFNSKGIRISFNNPLFYCLSLPLDMILGLAGRSGLITAYAFKE